MIKKLINLFKVRTIRSCVYKMDAYVPLANLPRNLFDFNLKTERQSGKCIRYFIEENNLLVHQSCLYSKVFLMRLIRKNGPVIGNCFTHPTYRGRSIYPYVINYIAKQQLELGNNEVFVNVDFSNTASIKGIERAGFIKYASIHTKRWLVFHIKPEIEYY